jgi:hypothetical protein
MFCVNCYFLIVVVATTELDYTILVAPSGPNLAILLRDNRQMSDIVQLNTSNHYHYYGTAFTLKVTLFNGLLRVLTKSGLASY